MTDDELRRQITEILLPRPWPHAKTYMWRSESSTCLSSVPPGNWVGNPCSRCKEPVYNELGCRVPPKLTDPWPVLAERLLQNGGSAAELAARLAKNEGLGGNVSLAGLCWWLSHSAQGKCEKLVEAMQKCAAVLMGRRASEMAERVKMLVEKTRITCCTGWGDKCPYATYDPARKQWRCKHDGAHYNEVLDDIIPDWCPLPDWEGDDG